MINKVHFIEDMRGYTPKHVLPVVKKKEHRNKNTEVSFSEILKQKMNA